MGRFRWPVWLGLTFEHGPVYGYLGNVLGCVNIITKGVIGVTVMMWVRWTLPRLRIDQVITTCLKYCVPIAAVCFLGRDVVAIHVAERPVSQDADRRSYELRENWPDGPGRESARQR